ncbi:MAG: UDP-3-O-acyl-N-acetylglucosamine deacetylase [Parachlamydiales bacterium]
MTQAPEKTSRSVLKERIIGTRKPNTLRRPAQITGIGLHLGNRVEMRLCPAPAGTGVLFKRVDLPGSPLIPAHLDYVEATLRNTTIANGKAQVYTVEHVLAALKAYEIDNVVIELSSGEPPNAEGCAEAFVRMIHEAGIEEQQGEVPIVGIAEPIYWSQKGIHIVALPAERRQISYTIHYPQASAIGSQYYSVEIDADHFKRELAPCRTFALYEEIAALMEAGLIKGGSLDSGLVIKGGEIMTTGGLRFLNEPVRHKILDMVGDLSLLGIDWVAHVIAICSGHAANTAFGRRFLNHVTGEGE